VKLAVALLAAGLLTLTGCGGGESVAEPEPAAAPVTAPEPETFNVSGSLTLSDGAMHSRLEPCSGSGGYDDIGQGTQITIRDGDGTKVALGALASGHPGGSTVGCIYRYAVLDVPAGGGIYSVEVGSRGEINFTEAEAGNVSLTLG